jgi:hypothetical protein
VGAPTPRPSQPPRMGRFFFPGLGVVLGGWGPWTHTGRSGGLLARG